MTAGAGEADASSRRWRVSLNVFAWLYLVQSAAGIVTAPLVLLALGLSGSPSGSEIGQLGELLGPGGTMLGELVLRAGLIVRLSLVTNAVTLVGCIGLLKRLKWGWLTVIGVQVLSTAVAFIWGLPLLTSLLSLVAPLNAGLAGVAILVLLALVPASVVAFLLSGPVVRQFERPAASAGTPDKDGG